mmetsp:Transcript_20060/g.52102  ORF Transcript_20060/g.52102 Transcript_20060/m.52102 type:complete len:234 (+) Transcript_20060:475-1176(+)
MAVARMWQNANAHGVDKGGVSLPRQWRAVATECQRDIHRQSNAHGYPRNSRGEEETTEQGPLQKKAQSILHGVQHGSCRAGAGANGPLWCGGVAVAVRGSCCRSFFLLLLFGKGLLVEGVEVALVNLEGLPDVSDLLGSLDQVLDPKVLLAVRPKVEEEVLNLEAALALRRVHSPSDHRQNKVAHKILENGHRIVHRGRHVTKAIHHLPQFLGEEALSSLCPAAGDKGDAVRR